MFDFLAGPTANHIEDWSGALLHGAIVTLQVSVIAYFIGLAIGMMVAVVKLRAGPLPVALAYMYTRTFRSIPELLLIILLYYAGSSGLSHLVAWINPDWQFEINGFAAAVGVLAIVQGAYASEVIRGAIQAVPVGEIEAARAFALGRFKLWWRIIIPAMLPLALPGLANLWIVLIKDSSLISVVGFGELMMAAKTAGGSTRMYFTFYCVAGALYLVITLISNLLFGLVERHFRVAA